MAEAPVDPVGPPHGFGPALPPGPPGPAVPGPPGPPGPPGAGALNWSHFMPTFSGEVEKEDARAHLLRTNDWMQTHGFAEGVKCQRFCLTLTGEARLWYESLLPIADDWPALQDRFLKKYSKVGHTRTELYFRWRVMKWDDTGESIESYVQKIRHLANLLGYGEPQVLELLKHSIPSRYFWPLIHTDDVNQCKDMIEMLQTKEKLEGHTTGQAPATPFLQLRNINQRNEHKVQFETSYDVLDRKIDKLADMMSRLDLTKGYRQGKPSSKPYKPYFTPNRGRINSRGRGYDRGRSPNFRIDQSWGNRNPYCNRRNYRGRGRDRNFRSRSWSGNRSRSKFQNRRSSNRSRSRSPSQSSGSETQEDRRCYNCHEIGHFAAECKNKQKFVSRDNTK